MQTSLRANKPSTWWVPQQVHMEHTRFAFTVLMVMHGSCVAACEANDHCMKSALHEGCHTAKCSMKKLVDQQEAYSVTWAVVAAHILHRVIAFGCVAVKYICGGLENWSHSSTPKLLLFPTMDSLSFDPPFPMRDRHPFTKPASVMQGKL